jgi:hypothetical protein
MLMGFARSAWYFKHRALYTYGLPDLEMFNSKELRRLKHYFYGTTYLSLLFCLLRGQTRTREEKKTFTNLAALAYFFDDLVDDFRKKDDSGNTWSNNPELFGKIADNRGLSLHFLDNIYNTLAPEHKTEFVSYMHEVFNAETTGRQQAGLQLSEDELYQLTVNKGGYSVLMFRRVLAHPMNEAEKTAWMELGGFIQLCDDIYDLWFDAQDDTHTLTTHFAATNELEELILYFNMQQEKVKQALGATNFSTWQVRTCYSGVKYLSHVTEVCLQHYIHLLAIHTSLPVENRKIIVVDMERRTNRIASIVCILKGLVEQPIRS